MAPADRGLLLLLWDAIRKRKNRVLHTSKLCIYFVQTYMSKHRRILSGPVASFVVLALAMLIEAGSMFAVLLLPGEPTVRFRVLYGKMRRQELGTCSEGGENPLSVLFNGKIAFHSLSWRRGSPLLQPCPQGAVF